MGVQTLERRLAAILTADMVGYSRLMEADDEETIARQKACRESLIDPSVADHHGRVVKSTGDGLLVEFASAVDAVRCAIEVQEAMQDRESDVPEGRRIVYRIGVNVGDIVVDDDDILGDGVNVSARLEQLADPGGLCISNGVWESLGGRLSVGFEYAGEASVKNISRPIRLWKWSGETGERKVFPGAARSIVRMDDKPSIAVLPFDNMSGQQDQEYFSDGITEDLITALSKYRWLFVIARNSTFAYKGRPVDVKRIAAELGVRYVLEGSVRRQDERVRVTAQLVDAATGNHLWADRFDRAVQDVFDLQDDITSTIAGALEPELSGAEQARARQKPPGSLDAWERYQQGMWHFWRTTPRDNASARELFHSALSLDPEFGPACSGLAYLGFTDLIFGFTDNPGKTLTEALQHGRMAAQIDDKDAFARLALGRIYTMLGQHDAAIAELEHAISLNPSFALGHSALAHALHWAGRPSEALPYFDAAMRLSPHDPMLWAIMMMKSAAYFMLEDSDNALAWANKAVRQDSSKYLTHVHLAAALIGANELQEARREMEEAVRLNPDLSEKLVNRILGNQKPEYVAPFLGALRKAGLPG